MAIRKIPYSLITTEKQELFYTMKYAHTFIPLKQDFPPFWEKEHFKVPLMRLDTSRMSPVDKALLENTLMRIKTVEDSTSAKIEQEKLKAVESTKKEAVKKLLTMGLGTAEQIAEVQGISLEFVIQVKKNLAIAQKRKTQNNRKK